MSWGCSVVEEVGGVKRYGVWVMRSWRGGTHDRGGGVGALELLLESYVEVNATSSFYLLANIKTDVIVGLDHKA